MMDFLFYKCAAFPSTRVTGVVWNYCDVFISCLDSHSDGTHSLQRIPLVSKWLQCYISPNLFWRRNKLIYILDDLRVSTFSANVLFCVNYSFNNHCVIKIWARFVIWCFCFSSPFVVILCLYCSRLACIRVVTVELLWAVMCMWYIKYYCERKHSEIYSSNIKNISMYQNWYTYVYTHSFRVQN